MQDYCQASRRAQINRELIGSGMCKKSWKRFFPAGQGMLCASAPGGGGAVQVDATQNR